MEIVARVSSVLTAEAQAILNIPDETIQKALPAFCRLLQTCTGKVIVIGMGKVGHVGRRAAATFSSTGTPAIFLHPGEAAHGDMGVLCAQDILLALSNSGRTREVLEAVAQAQQRFPSLVVGVITGHVDSPLAALATELLCYGSVEEPCPLGLTPSASLAVMSAVLDALALVTMEQRGFTRERWARNHHSGYLGSLARGEQIN